MTQHVGSFPTKPGEPLHIVTTAAARYAVTCTATGTRVEFSVLPGQEFTIIGGTCDVKVDILESTPASQTPPPQLVSPAAPAHS